MPRVSQEQAARNRQDVITSAAKLFRERGLNGVSVPELMEAVGLTHGGFYKQFASKDELIGLALDEAFGQSYALGSQLRAENRDTAAQREAYIDFYLSPDHRDKPGTGCPNAALCIDIGRAGKKDPLHPHYARHLEKSLKGLSTMMPEADPVEARASAINLLASLVGAMVIARASQGSPLSDEVLETVKAKLLPD